ncbi:monovalent cation/H(+) antiporter subunit G [Falsirhodobacter algicola]|uniref:Cation:proton antiporter n=1 Tax=Falsirhodobacter algicola TaxID=2692330 RepID=A0A8J8SKE6_9RHOB|nr:monovalent cation/H(+) antiporter subunit G [Falsirhodobacter algicola]QUS35339.1 cation:proton antiporter [Falsirhodobacter algicola]
MTEVPTWLAVVVAGLLILGAGLTLLGAVGMLRFPLFYQRLHAPALGNSGGTLAIILASMLFFSTTGDRIVVHEILIGFFIMCTTPVTLMLLGRAALYRDRARKSPPPTEE